ncbi:MAG TPA: NB-ARC domain-containing protein [Caldilineaceae bacterium]|nr:NB-ARC domain-containing protein [Caldilineaceae bacterium]
MDQLHDHEQWSDLAHEILQNGHNPQFRSARLEQTFLFRQLLRTHPGDHYPSVTALVDDALTRLARNHPQDEALLRARFIRQLPPHQVARESQIAQSTLFRFQRRALQRLGDLLATLDEEARNLHFRLIEQRIEPATTGELFGVAEQVQMLARLLATPGEPWMVCVEGIGGIGKTTLANAVVRELLGRPTFVDVAWVSIQPRTSNPLHAWAPTSTTPGTDAALLKAIGEQLLDPADSALLALPDQLRAVLQSRLRRSPHLLVIDNIETEQELAALRGSLQRLLNPSKVLLTSRFSPLQESDLFPYRVHELSAPDAQALVRHEAKRRNLPELAAVGESELRVIYEAVGGNPLALRLVVGQSRSHGLHAVLNDLYEARGQAADELYAYIYWHAWRNLEPLAKDVLLAMPLAPLRGASLDYLQAITQLETGRLGDALNQLISQNLVDSYGDLRQRRYTIHGLTRTFLLEQVTKWLPPQPQNQARCEDAGNSSV